MFSQNDEEQVILDWFKGRHKEGLRFLDVGAYTGKELSNTRALMELGWGGVCVEPNPNSFAALTKNCKEFPKVQLTKVAVTAGIEGPLKFFASDDAVSTTEVAHRDLWKKSGVPYHEIEVRGISMSTLLKLYPPPFAFFNLDVEATNWPVFNTTPVKIMAPELICIEFDSHRKEIEAKCNRLGYRLIHGTGENLIFGKK